MFLIDNLLFLDMRLESDYHLPTSHVGLERLFDIVNGMSLGFCQLGQYSQSLKNLVVGDVMDGIKTLYGRKLLHRPFVSNAVKRRKGGMEFSRSPGYFMIKEHFQISRIGGSRR